MGVTSGHCVNFMPLSVLSRPGIISLAIGHDQQPSLLQGQAMMNHTFPKEDPFADFSNHIDGLALCFVMMRGG